MGFYNILPAYILNHTPKIIVAFDTDFLRNQDAFRTALQKNGDLRRGGTIILQIGWTNELLKLKIGK